MHYVHSIFCKYTYFSLFPHFLLTGLLSDEQCRARDVRRKARQVMQGTRRTFQNTEEFLGHQSIITPPQSLDDESGTTVNPLDRVSESTKDLIRKLVYYQDIYELPKEEDIKNMQVTTRVLCVLS